MLLVWPLRPNPLPPQAKWPSVLKLPETEFDKFDNKGPLSKKKMCGDCESMFYHLKQNNSQQPLKKKSCGFPIKQIIPFFNKKQATY